MTTQLTPNRPEASHASQTTHASRISRVSQAPRAVGVSAAVVTAALVLGMLIQLVWPLLTTSFVVFALGGVAAVIALAALAATVRLVVTDVWSDVRRALERRARRRHGPVTGPDAPAASIAPLGHQLSAYHAARSAR